MNILDNLYSTTLFSDAKFLCSQTSIKDLRDTMQNSLIQDDEIPFETDPQIPSWYFRPGNDPLRIHQVFAGLSSTCQYLP